MALDKQRILSELGNVMNQLQSADCGCMGKLFSNPGGQGSSAMSGSPLPTCSGCRHGGCHGHGYNNCSPHTGYGAPCAGEPYSSMNHQGHCNPRKLYSDTYNYLSQNLMQPVIKEVYDDLNSLTPDNTISNNPLANQMGIAPGQSPMMSSPKGHLGNMNTNAMGSHDPMIHSVQYSNQMNMQPMEQAVNMQNQVPQNINGMGPQIVDMVFKGNELKPSSAGQGGQLTGPMVVEAPQSPHGQVGITPLTPMRHNQHQYAMNMTHGNGISYTDKQNNFLDFNKQGHMQNDALNMAQINNLQSNPAAQQMAVAHNHYGHHNPGIKKFNEMFPGVMQGLGGDLGFDPMAIAVQMNPANHQKAAMATMQKLMNGNVGVDKLKPDINGANVAADNIANLKSAGAPQQNIFLSNPDTQNAASYEQAVSQQIEQNQSQGRNIGDTSIAQQQRVLAAKMGAPSMNKQTLLQQTSNSEQYQVQQSQPNDQSNQQQQIQNIDTNQSGLTSYQNQNDNKQNLKIQDPHSNRPIPQQVKEHLLPVDTSRYQLPIGIRQQRSNEYNTLGQPIEMLPAQLYYRPVPTLPQTLSPQDAPKRLPANNYSNVKSTVSKTSLMGNRRASRSQLQHVYNQYKGSQSFTQQNIKGHDQAGPSTASQGKLNIPNKPQQTPQLPIERVGGDTISNNNHVNNPVSPEQVGKPGDGVPMNKPHGDVIPDKVPTAKATRNGIQDMTFPAYTSCSWSFQRPVQSLYGNSNRYRR